MGSCHCCENPHVNFQSQALSQELSQKLTSELKVEVTKGLRRRGKPVVLSQSSRLFNWVTVLLVTGWVAIVAIAAELANPANVVATPTVDVFLRQLL